MRDAIHYLARFKFWFLVGMFLAELARGAGPSFSPTEQFIPIGSSPGLSQEGKTLLGFVTARNGLKLTVILVAPIKVLKMNGMLKIPPSETRTIHLTTSTIIYVDRSKVQRQNTVGTLADLQPHRLVEVYQDKWIKVRVE